MNKFCQILKKFFFLLLLFIVYFPQSFGQGVGINIVRKGKVCRPLEIWVKNTTTTPNVIQFIYEWGDGTTDTFPASNAGDTVYHKFDSSQVGKKNIVLVSISKDGTSSASTSITIYSEDDANILAFGFTCNGNMKFADNSTLNGSPDSTRNFSWIFGDGKFGGNDSVVTHTYPLTDSSYIVKMGVNNGCGWAYAQTTIRVLPELKPAIVYTLPPCERGNIQFSSSDTITGINYNYLWDFGDGSPTSTLSNPVHLYQTPDSFKINLKIEVQNSDSSCIKNTSTKIKILNAPNTDFTTNFTPACDSVLANFNNISTGAQSYHWDFGNGDTSDLMIAPAINFQACRGIYY